jgi:L-lysine 6-transaminase
MSVNSSDVLSILSRHLLTDGYDMVLDLENSHGSYLRDSRTGTDYLDFFTFFASSPLGMNHPRLAGDADFLQKMGRIAIQNPSNSDIYTEEMAEFVQTFSRVGIPDYLPYAFFVAGGALAVENAIKVAFDWKVQKNFRKGYRTEKGHMVMHFERAFHGRSGYTMSLTNTEPNKVKYFPKFDWPRVSSPAIRFPLTPTTLAEVEAAEKLAIAQAERYFEIHKDDIAAILIEPIQAEGGDRHFRPQFHQELRRLADEHEALLIYDEVQTGVGLTGRFWCHEHFVKPDIIAFGKKTQVCGILAGKRIDDIETNCFHVSSRINSTWGGNLVDMARFTRILEIIEQDRLVDHVARTGDWFLGEIQALADRHEHIGNARGKGLMCAIDLPDTHSRNAVIRQCKHNGLMILPCGTQTIRFRPTLCVAKEDLSKGLDILETSYLEAMKMCPVVGRG